MAIRVVLDGDAFCPRVFCDQCGQRIERAREGNYQWWLDGDGTLFFTHKRCCRAFEENHGGRSGWCWGELSALPFYLVQNLGLTWAESRRIGTWLGSL